MSNLPSTFPGLIQVEETRFKASVSEYLAQKIGRAINYILNTGFNKQEYTTPGTYNFPVPPAVKFFVMRVVGGGRGGDGGEGFFVGGNGGKGGEGAQVHDFVLNVEGVASVDVVVGSGGAAGLQGGSGFPATAGSNGGNSTLTIAGKLIFTAKGGNTVVTPTPIADIFSPVEYNIAGGPFNSAGSSSNLGLGGTAGAPGSYGNGGGGGGGASFGNGGAGGDGIGGISGPFPGLVGTGYGSGGGGGGGSNNPGVAGQNGAPGKDGFVGFYWFGNA